MFQNTKLVRDDRVRFKSVKQSGRLSERVSSQLEDAILKGKIRATEQLPTEASLGESFGVSRTVVREAIKRLEAQGLVESHVGSGSYVSAYSVNHIKLAMERYVALNPEREVFLHVLDLRRVLELETVERMARSHTTESLVPLSDTLLQLKQATNDRDAFALADMEFHLVIARASGNPFFVNILEPLKNTGRAFGLATYEGNKLMNHVIREHQGIYDAIAMGDPSLARGRVLEHIEFSRTHYLQLIESQTAANSKEAAQEAK